MPTKTEAKIPPKPLCFPSGPDHREERKLRFRTEKATDVKMNGGGTRSASRNEGLNMKLGINESTWVNDTSPEMGIKAFISLGVFCSKSMLSVARVTYLPAGIETVMYVCLN